MNPDSTPPIDPTRTAEFAAELDHHLGQEVAALTPPNRAQRRANIKRMRRLVIRPDAGVKLLHHPLLNHLLMPFGEKALAKRRAAEKVAKVSRQVNRGGGKRRGSPPMGPRTPKQEVQGS